MENKRIGSIDALKGIGIVLVILGHTHGLFRNYIFSFHMPLFFFISGFLFNIEKYKSVGVFIKKKFKTLLIPYIFFSFISLIVAFIVTNNESDILQVVKQLLISSRNNININPTLWFLTCLFIIELLFYGVSKTVKNKYLKFIIILILSIVGFFSSKTISLPFSLNLAAYYLMFYLLGSLFKGIKQTKKMLSIYSACLFIGIILFIKPSYFESVNIFFQSNNLLEYLYSLLIAIIGILGCMRLSFILQKSDILGFFGRNSLIIFALHIFILDGIYYLLTSLGLTVNQGYNVYSISVTIVCLFVIKPLITYLNQYFSFFVAADNIS